METGECVGDVVRAPQTSDGSCGSVEYRLHAGGCTCSLVSLPSQHCRSPAGTGRGQRRVFGKRTSAPNVECCAADEERQSNWQQFPERGIACHTRYADAAIPNISVNLKYDTVIRRTLVMAVGSNFADRRQTDRHMVPKHRS